MPTKDATNDSYAFVKDGKVELVPVTQGYKDAINTISKWYKEGWLWSECYTTNKETYSARLNSETPIWGAALTRKMPTQHAYANEQLAFVAPPAIEGYEARIYVNPGVFGTKNCFSLTNKCSEEDAKIIMAWLDTFYSQEGTLGYIWNMETDETPRYEVKDGKLTWTTLTVEQDEQLKKDNPAMADILGGAYIYTRTSDMYQNLFPVDATNQALWDTYNNIYKDYWNNEIWPRPTFTEEATEDVAFYQTDVYAIINEYEAKWVTGASDINADWDAYITKMEKAGSKELTKLLQEAYDIYLQNYKPAE